MVAVKNHFHAVTNPKAQLRYEITVEQALAAPMVVDPFGLYDHRRGQRLLDGNLIAQLSFRVHTAGKWFLTATMAMCSLVAGDSCR